MRTLTATTSAVLATMVLAGASTIPAEGDSPEQDSKVHTRHLVSRDIDSHSLGPHTFAGAAVDRHAGRIVGYDTFTGHFYPSQQRYAGASPAPQLRPVRGDRQSLDHQRHCHRERDL